MYTVKEAAEIMNISPHTLRFYDNEGLLPTLSRRNKRRLFSEQDLEWVFNIQCWRECGMPLAGIRRYIELAREGDGTLEERYQMIMALHDKANEDIKAAKYRAKILERKMMWYQEIMRGEDAARWRPNIKQMIKKSLEMKKKTKKQEKPREAV